MFRYIFFLLFLHVSLTASEVAHFKEVGNNKNVTFFLSTPRSGTNVVTGCLSAITRKPIAWFQWGESIVDPSSKHRQHVSYNRLELDLISEIPLLYRTHSNFNKLTQLPSELNNLIFVTRNPKELIYRSFYLQNSFPQEPDSQFIERFFVKYLKAFETYEAWHGANRMLVFYEDFIVNDNDLLLQMLHLMKEPATYYEDFITNKQDYLNKLLESYSNQHKSNYGGASSKGAPKEIFYTKNASPEVLRSIDEYLQRKAPKIWNKYLKRFQTNN